MKNNVIGGNNSSLGELLIMGKKSQLIIPSKQNTFLLST